MVQFNLSKKHPPCIQKGVGFVTHITKSEVRVEERMRSPDIGLSAKRQVRPPDSPILRLQKIATVS